MLRRFLTPALAALLSTTCLAQEPSLCKSLCDSERATCKKRAPVLASSEFEDMRSRPHRNELARTAQETQALAAGARAGEAGSEQSRRMRFAAACDDAHARCTRSCAAPPPRNDAPVSMRQQRSADVGA